jgi:hypothetical protein
MDDLANRIYSNNSVHSSTISYCDRYRYRAVLSSNWKLPRSTHVCSTLTSFRDLCTQARPSVASCVLKVATSFYAEMLGELQDTTELNPKIILSRNKCLLHHTQMIHMFREPLVIATLLNKIFIRKYTSNVNPIARMFCHSLLSLLLFLLTHLHI